MPAKKGNKYAVGNNGGRRPKYKDEYAEQAYELALLGLIDREIASFFKVSEKTLNRWKIDHEVFCQSLKRGKLPADAKVALSLYKRALGYTYDEVTFEKIDSKTNLEITSAGDIKQDDTYKKKIVVKEISPDVTAQIFYLKNRQKDKWKDRHHLAGGIELKNTLESLSDSDLEKLMNLIVNKH